MVALTLVTTGLGVLLPVFRDAGHLDTRFGRLFLAAGTIGEVGPIVVMSLLLSQRYSTWQEVGFLVVFLAIVIVAAAVGSDFARRACSRSCSVRWMRARSSRSAFRC